MKEKDQLQKNISKNSTDLDVQGQHNICFCQEIDQTDIEPRISKPRNKNTSMASQVINQ